MDLTSNDGSITLRRWAVGIKIVPTWFWYEICNLKQHPSVAFANDLLKQMAIISQFSAAKMMILGGKTDI